MAANRDWEATCCLFFGRAEGRRVRFFPEDIIASDTQVDTDDIQYTNALQMLLDTLL